MDHNDQESLEIPDFQYQYKTVKAVNIENFPNTTDNMRSPHYALREIKNVLQDRR